MMEKPKGSYISIGIAMPLKYERYADALAQVLREQVEKNDIKEFHIEVVKFNLSENGDSAEI